MKSLARSLILLVAVTTAVATSVASPKVPAAPPSAPKAASAPAASPESIPVPEVARQAEEVARLVRDFDTLLVPGPGIEAMEGRLPEIAARVTTQSDDTHRDIEAQSSSGTLDALTVQWQTTRGELVGYVNALGKKATTIEEALDRLAGVGDAWSRTRVEALASRAPAQVIERIDGVLSAVASSRTRLTAQRAAILVLQDRVAREVARCEAALERIAVARAGSTGRLFERDSVPLWDVELRAQAVTALPDRVRSVLAADAAVWRQFAWDQRWKIPVQAGLFLGLLLLIRAAGRRMPLWAARGDSTPAVAFIVEGWVSAPLLFALLAFGWIYPLPLPRPVGALVAALALLPALRLMRLLLDPALVRSLYVLGAFFLADIVRHLASAVAILEQQIFLLEMLAGVAVMAWQVLGWRRAATASAALTGSARVSRAATMVVLLAFATALVAGAAGYMRLALLLGAGVLVNGYLAVVLYTGLRVADGLVAFALRGGPSALSGWSGVTVPSSSGASMVCSAGSRSPRGCSSR